MTKASPTRLRKRVNSGPQVELSDPAAHPVVLGYQFNGIMGKFELLVCVGNFDSEEDAQRYGKELLTNGVFSNARAIS